MDPASAFLIARYIRRTRTHREAVNRRILRDSSNPMNIQEELFLKKFRLSKDLFLWLCDEIRPFMRPPKRSFAVSLELKLLTTLSFLATGSYQTLVGKNWHSYQSQKGVSRHIEEVTSSLQSIMEKHIAFPQNAQELEKLKQGFYEDFGMPDVIACIDGTHVAILKPNPQEEVYLNKQRFHSMNVAIICDSKGKLLGINAKHGGATHDSHVYKNMALYPYIKSLRRTVCFWILGDSSYPLSPWMMTPIPNVEPGSQEEQYNNLHRHTMNTADRCISVIKNRWRCLLGDKILHYKPPKVALIVNACAVLHNIVKKANLPDDEYATAIENTLSSEDDDVMGVDEYFGSGQAVRDILVQKIINLHL